MELITVLCLAQDAIFENICDHKQPRKIRHHSTDFSKNTDTNNIMTIFQNFKHWKYVKILLCMAYRQKSRKILGKGKIKNK